MWTLAWPWLLLALPLPWFVRRFMPPTATEHGPALRVPAGGGLDAPARRAGHSRRGSWRLVALWLVWALVLLAAARPRIVGEPVSVPVTGRDLLLAVDLSGSMSQRDFKLNGHWVNRLQALKVAADHFIEHRVGDRVGLILFGRHAYLQVPLTFDRKTVRMLLDEAVIGLAGRQTAIGDAIGLGIKTFADAGVTQGRRVIVLLTDGANTAGEVRPLKAAKLAAARGVTIYTIGIGAKAPLTIQTMFGVQRINPSAALNEATLKAIAQVTGGQYFRVRNTQGFERLYRELDKLEPVPSEESGFRPVTKLFYWPLGLAVLLAAGLALVEMPGRRRWFASGVGDG